MFYINDRRSRVTLLEMIQSRPMPFAVLMGVSFTQAEGQRWSRLWWSAGPLHAGPLDPRRSE